MKDEKEDTDGNESSASSGDTDSKEIIDRIASSQISNGERNNGGKTSGPKEKTQASRGDSKARILRIVKLSQIEQMARNDEKKQQEMEMIGKAVGFSKVIRKISESVRRFLQFGQE